MKVASMQVSAEFLADFLELPNGSNIVGVTWDERHRRVELIVEHPDFKDVVSQSSIPTIRPLYTTPGPGQPAQFVSWGDEC